MFESIICLIGEISEKVFIGNKYDCSTDNHLPNAS